MSRILLILTSLLWLPLLLVALVLVVVTDNLQRAFRWIARKRW